VGSIAVPPSTLAGPSTGEDLMQHSFRYVDCTIPAGITIAAYRRSVQPKPARRRFRPRLWLRHLAGGAD